MWRWEEWGWTPLYMTLHFPPRGDLEIVTNDLKR